MPNRYVLSPDLIQFHTPTGSIMADGCKFIPVYIREDMAKVEHLLESLNQSISADQVETTGLQKATFDEYPVARHLIDSGIIVDTYKAAFTETHLCSSKILHEPTDTPLTRCNCASPPQKTTLYLLCTQFCNLACIYCYNGDDSYERDKALRMPLSIAQQSISMYASRVPESGELEIVFFGGEPLLNWDLITTLTDWTASEVSPTCKGHIHYHITTNLTVLPCDFIEYARKYSFTILVNIDGDSPTHNLLRPSKSAVLDSFANTTKHFKMLVEAGIIPAARATVTSQNVSALTDIVSLHKELGASSTALVPVNPTNSDSCNIAAKLLPDAESYEASLKEVLAAGLWPETHISPLSGYLTMFHQMPRKSHACGAPVGATPVVDVYGNIYPCIYVVGVDKYIIGDVKTQYIDRHALEDIQSRFHIDNMDECCQCSYRNFCAGSCYATQFFSDGKDDQIVARRRKLSCITTRSCVEFLMKSLFGLSTEPHLDQPRDNCATSGSVSC